MQSKALFIGVAVLLTVSSSSPVRIKRDAQDQYIAQINEVRQNMARKFGITNMAQLVLDNELAVSAADETCDSLSHGSNYRYFLTMGDEAAKAWDKKKDDAFHETAANSIDLAMEQRGDSMGEIETLVPTQTKIGCAAMNCTGKNGHKYQTLCFIGEKRSVSSADFQFSEGAREGYSSQLFEEYIKSLNTNRQRVANSHQISNMQPLVADKGLIKKAAGLGCTLESGPDYRVFWVTEGVEAEKFSKRVVSKFFKDARSSGVEQAVQNAGQYLGYVEALSKSQTKIGCAHRKCNHQGQTHSAVCLVGPKSTLTSVDLPLKRN